MFDALFSSLRSAVADAAGKPYTNISNDEMRSQMAKPNTIVLDVRTEAETKTGTLPGALCIDITRPDFAQRIAKLDPAATYLVYCRSGSRSAHACLVMAQQGFTSLYNLQRGIMGWK